MSFNSHIQTRSIEIIKFTTSSNATIFLFLVSLVEENLSIHQRRYSGEKEQHS